ncbi:uncharacterized protein [Henckelia pumila]|uniref:uncharacterized protein n=1 Tax=Henckelia pumila TaxID=405737 RepID=UPI003C6E1698
MGPGAPPKSPAVKVRKSTRVSRRLATQFYNSSKGQVNLDDDDTISASPIPTTLKTPVLVLEGITIQVPGKSKEMESPAEKRAPLVTNDDLVTNKIPMGIPFMIPPTIQVNVPEAPIPIKTSDTVTASISSEDHASRRIQMCTLPTTTMDLDFSFLHDTTSEPITGSSSFPDQSSTASATTTLKSLVHQDVFSLDEHKFQDAMAAFQLLQSFPGFVDYPLGMTLNLLPTILSNAQESASKYAVLSSKIDS